MFKDALDFRFQSLKLIMLILFKMVLRVRVTAKRKMENVVSSQETPCLIFLLAFTPTLHFEQIQQIPESRHVVTCLTSRLDGQMLPVFRGSVNHWVSLGVCDRVAHAA